MAGNNTSDANVIKFHEMNAYIIYLAVSSVLCAVGIFLNSLIVYVFAQDKRSIQQTSFNVSLYHLSIASIGQYISLIPHLAVDLSRIDSKYTRGWLQIFICNITDALTLFFCFAFVTAIILCYITVTRYLLIKDPINNHVDLNKTRIYLAICWITGFILLIPNTLSWSMDRKNGFCIRGNVPFFHTYSWLAVVVGLVLPIFLMTNTYFLTVYKFYIRRNVINVIGRTIKYQKHVTGLLGVLILIYILSWVPYGVYWILSMWQFFGKGIQAEHKKSTVMRLCLLPSFCAGIMNALFYGFASREIRKSVIKRIIVRKGEPKHVKDKPVVVKAHELFVISNK